MQRPDQRVAREVRCPGPIVEMVSLPKLADMFPPVPLNLPHDCGARYGGHIVNDFDRLLANEYLDWYMKDELLDETELYPFAEDEKGVSFLVSS